MRSFSLDHTRKTSMKGLIAAFVTSLVTLGMIGVGPASAEGRHGHGGEDAIRITALASAPLPDNTVCPETTSSLGANLMTGTMVGCWYGDTGTSRGPVDNHDGGKTYTQTFVGTEHFVGCIDKDRDGVCSEEDPTGTWKTTFVFTGIFLWAGGAEISGGCTHPIISGTGDFKGARGTIFMTDNVNDGTSNVTGSVSLRDD